MGRGSQRNQGKTKNQRRDDIERKRDERSQRNTLRKEKQANANGFEDDAFKSFRNQLQAQGFKMRDVIGDGNCLFRALADQLDGNEQMHHKHRKETVTYMTEHEDEFIPFLEETVAFKDYLKTLSSRGTYGGNDSIVAFARSNGVDVIIHQLHNPTFIIEGNNVSNQKTVVHLAYHDYEHYSSVRRINDPCTGPAHTFHKETDSIPTEKCIDKREDGTTATEQGCENNEASRKVKRKNKKKCAQKVQENECEANDDFVSEAIEEIRTKCGSEDTEYIKNVFVDNSYDIDSTLSFLFQTMHLHDDNKSDAAQSLTCAEDVDLEESAANHICDTNKELLHEVETVENNDYIEINEVLSPSSCLCPESSKCTAECSCEGVEEEKGSNFNEVKKKNIPVANKHVAAKHMSNRQRKELAKQARKKRRQESRKSDSNTNESPPSEQAGENIKSINI